MPRKRDAHGRFVKVKAKKVESVGVPTLRQLADRHGATQASYPRSGPKRARLFFPTLKAAFAFSAAIKPHHSLLTVLTSHGDTHCVEVTERYTRTKLEKPRHPNKVIAGTFKVGKQATKPTKKPTNGRYSKATLNYFALIDSISTYAVVAFGATPHAHRINELGRFRFPSKHKATEFCKSITFASRKKLPCHQSGNLVVVGAPRK